MPPARGRGCFPVLRAQRRAPGGAAPDCGLHGPSSHTGRLHGQVPGVHRAWARKGPDTPAGARPHADSQGQTPPATAPQGFRKLLFHTLLSGHGSPGSGGAGPHPTEQMRRGRRGPPRSRAGRRRRAGTRFVQRTTLVRGHLPTHRCRTRRSASSHVGGTHTGLPQTVPLRTQVPRNPDALVLVEVAVHVEGGCMVVLCVWKTGNTRVHGDGIARHRHRGSPT